MFIQDLRLKTFLSTGKKTRSYCGRGGGERGETRDQSQDTRFLAFLDEEKLIWIGFTIFCDISLPGHMSGTVSRPCVSAADKIFCLVDEH